MRTKGFPPDVVEPIFLFRDDKPIKKHASYVAAKAGDIPAAIRLVEDLTLPLRTCIEQRIAQKTWPAAPIHVAPHAREATGDNAIPQVLATMLSIPGGELDEDIVQTTRVYHTGADAMERLIARAAFQGKVRRHADYVRVDDVTTLGGTLYDLADHIQRNGGHVAGVVVLVNASRSGRLFPSPKTVQRLEKEFGHVIREIFGIEPTALTADEAQYLIGFRTAEEIRSRSAKAGETTNLRLRAKGIRPATANRRLQQNALTPMARVPFPGASALTYRAWKKTRHRA